MMRILLILLIVIIAFFAIRACGGSEYLAWNVSEKKETALFEALESLPEAGMVFVGELHDSEEHHRLQLEVIRRMHEQGRKLSVGLEMFERANQPQLDDWINGEIEEQEMRRVFNANWGHNWPLYSPIFLYCREEGIPMAALNVPRSVTRKVARQGFESLTDEERGMLPPITCDVTPEYMDFLRRVLGGHGAHGGEETFMNFCEAQVVWDTAMAVHALDFLREREAESMVVVCGMVHAWKPAIPRQVEKRRPDMPRTVFQPLIPGRWDRETTDPRDADYLIVRP
jgi:uncharacterized iron-regulated protein